MTADNDFKIIKKWFIIMVLFISELFFYAWCRVQFTNTGYQITEALQNQKAYIETQNNLKIELARLKSPLRIAKIAGKEFGLIMPKQEQTITIHE